MSNFIEKLNNVSKAVERLPQRIAVVAVNFSKERFRQKNWVDRSRVKWKPRQRKDRGSLMVRTGRLKRSIRKIRVAKDYIIIGTNVPYAQIHNDGGTINKMVSVKSHKRKVTVQRQRTNIRTRKTTRTKKRVEIGETTVKAHKRKMNTTLPPRQFIGESAVLMRRIERQVERDIKTALKL